MIKNRYNLSYRIDSFIALVIGFSLTNHIMLILIIPSYIYYIYNYKNYSVLRIVLLAVFILVGCSPLFLITIIFNNNMSIFTNSSNSIIANETPRSSWVAWFRSQISLSNPPLVLFLLIITFYIEIRCFNSVFSLIYVFPSAFKYLSSPPLNIFLNIVLMLF